jgi:hypothetical protein
VRPCPHVGLKEDRRCDGCIAQVGSALSADGMRPVAHLHRSALVPLRQARASTDRSDATAPARPMVVRGTLIANLCFCRRPESGVIEMAVKRVPYHEQPEFDDVGPISFGDRVLMWTIWPFVWLYELAVGPFNTRRVVRRLRANQFQPLAADQNADLPAVVREFLDATEAAAKRVGFHDSVRHRDFTRGTAVSCLSVIPSASGEDLCLCFASHTPRRLTMTGVVFQTRMSDGLLITTGNETGLPTLAMSRSCMTSTAGGRRGRCGWSALRSR